MTFGTLCTKGPRGTFAPHAFERMKSAVSLFQRLFGRSPRTSKYLVIQFRRVEHQMLIWLIGFQSMLQGLLGGSARAISAVGPGPTSDLGPLGIPNASPSSRSQTQTQTSVSPTVESKSQEREAPAHAIGASSNVSSSISPTNTWAFNPPQASTSASGSSNTLSSPNDSTPTSWSYTAQTSSTDTLLYPPTTLHPSTSTLNTLNTFNLTTPTASASSFLPLPIDPDSDYTSFTIQHQPTNSYRPLGMPIPPDDFVWSEPEGRPLKRGRWDDMDGSSNSNLNPGSSGGYGEQLQSRSQQTQESNQNQNHMSWLAQRQSIQNLHATAQAHAHGQMWNASPQGSQQPQWIPPSSHQPPQSQSHQQQQHTPLQHAQHPHPQHPQHAQSHSHSRHPSASIHLSHPHPHSQAHLTPFESSQGHGQGHTTHPGYAVYDPSSSSPVAETQLSSGLSGPYHTGGGNSSGGGNGGGWGYQNS